MVYVNGHETTAMIASPDVLHHVFKTAYFFVFGHGNRVARGKFRVRAIVASVPRRQIVEGEVVEILGL